jgi:hypothetical protein
MKHIQTFESFLNESKKEKMSKATYWEQVAVPGFGAVNTVKSDNDATKAAQALVDYWEKGKNFDKTDFTVKDAHLLDLSKAKAKDIILVKFVDGKANKDYQIKIEVRDTDLGVPQKNVYTWVSRVG